MGSMSTDPVFNEVVQIIRDSVNLHHIEPSRFEPETSLRDGGLGLDSVDILEIIIALEHRYGFKIEDAEQGKVHFRSVGSVAQFVRSRRPV